MHAAVLLIQVEELAPLIEDLVKARTNFVAHTIEQTKNAKVMKTRIQSVNSVSFYCCVLLSTMFFSCRKYECRCVTTHVGKPTGSPGIWFSEESHELRCPNNRAKKTCKSYENTDTACEIK